MKFPVPKKRKPSKKDPYSFTCVKCKMKITKSSYCVAQQAMNHAVFYTCECGEKQEVPQ